MNAIDIALCQRGSGYIALAVFLVNLINGHDARLSTTACDKQHQNQTEQLNTQALEYQRPFGLAMIWAQCLKIIPKEMINACNPNSDLPFVLQL